MLVTDTLGRVEVRLTLPGALIVGLGGPPPVSDVMADIAMVDKVLYLNHDFPDGKQMSVV